VGGGAGGVADDGGKAVFKDGDGTGWVSPAVAVEQVDEAGQLVVGQGEGGYGDGFVAFGEDQAAGPGWGGLPPSGHLEGFGGRVFCLQPYVQRSRIAVMKAWTFTWATCHRRGAGTVWALLPGLVSCPRGCVGEPPARRRHWVGWRRRAGALPGGTRPVGGHGGWRRTGAVFRYRWPRGGAL
jgi:hypothetical protein